MKSALCINGQIYELLSSLQGSQHLLKPSTLNLHKCENIRRVQSTKYISKYIDLNTNTHLVQQKSDEWFQLQKKSFITDSTMLDALGFHGKKELNNHFHEFPKKRLKNF